MNERGVAYWRRSRIRIVSYAVATGWRAMTQAKEAALIWIDESGIITGWGHGAEQLFGWSAEEAIGQSARLIVPDAYTQEDDDLRSRALRGAGDGQYRHDTATSSPGPESITVTCLAGDSKAKNLLVIASERKGREALETASRRLAAIVESSDDAIISKDLDGIVDDLESCSGADFRIFGR